MTAVCNGFVYVHGYVRILLSIGSINNFWQHNTLKFTLLKYVFYLKYPLEYFAVTTQRTIYVYTWQSACLQTFPLTSLPIHAFRQKTQKKIETHIALEAEP